MARRNGAVAVLAAMLVACASATGMAANGPYALKQPEITAPKGTAMGQVRRLIRPFAGWTLICDENLAERSKVCNVTQTFVDAGGATIFSWSLAASEDGKPIVILRVAPSVGQTGVISIRSHGRKAETVAVRACDDSVCVATMRLNASLREQIDLGATLDVSFTAGQPVLLEAPLLGLKEAVAAID